MIETTKIRADEVRVGFSVQQPGACSFYRVEKVEREGGKIRLVGGNHGPLDPDDGVTIEAVHLRTSRHLSTDRSQYVADDDRFVVMLAMGYGESEGDDDVGVTTPEEAARRALAATTDLGSLDTTWLVLDRQTGEVTVLEQEDFEKVELP